MKKISALLLLIICALCVKPAIAQKYDSDVSADAFVSRAASLYVLMSQDASVPAPDIDADEFDIPLDKVTRNSVWAVWKGACATPEHGHKIYYYHEWEMVKEVSVGVHEATVDQLNPAKRYSFSSSNVKHGVESSRSGELIVDTTPDSNPPNVPRGLNVKLLRPGKLRVSFISNNQNMIDFKGHKVYYGAHPDSYKSVDINADTSADISIQEGVSYYISVSAYDNKRNESGKTPAFVHNVQQPDDGGEDGGGCFIATAAFGSRNHPAVKIFREFRDRVLLNYNWGKRVVESYYQLAPKASKIIRDNAFLKIAVVILLAPALVFLLLGSHCGDFMDLHFKRILNIFNNNMEMPLAKKIICCLLLTLIFQNGYARWRGNDLIELKAGLFHPPDAKYDAKSPLSEKLKDKYDSVLLNNLIVNLSYARYLKKDWLIDFNVGLTGLCESKRSDDDDSSLKLVPLGLSINKILGIIRSAQYKVGAGLDYLLADGEVKNKDYSAGIGGYHAKIGVRYFMFTSELKYSVIDRFGRNKHNMGGWSLSAGMAFQFFLF